MVAQIEEVKAFSLLLYELLQKDVGQIEEVIALVLLSYRVWVKRGE
jgi:hypothetical protein